LFGFTTFPYFVLYECLGVIIEILSVAIVIGAWAYGLLDLIVLITNGFLKCLI